ncbi:hypothetical protein [Xanthomonas arboricola]|uniref:hypothetical protein n=1 Tax=Xanthomonas arboricola TaxID=56448 RepID=UPI003EC07769
MLPEGFHWTEAHQHQEGPPRMLALRSTGVARMTQRVDNGKWFVYLNYHLLNMDTTARTKDCSSFEAGRAGVEMWAARHEVRLRAEVAAIEAASPRHCGAG